MVSQPHEGHTKATQKPRKSNLRVLERKFANCKFLVLVGEKIFKNAALWGTSRAQKQKNCPNYWMLPTTNCQSTEKFINLSPFAEVIFWRMFEQLFLL